MAKAEIILKLSATEAGVLLQALHHVGGDPTGPRKSIDSIIGTLVTLGITPMGKLDGTISFEKN